jgi:hypothetical protein
MMPASRESGVLREWQEMARNGRVLGFFRKRPRGKVPGLIDVLVGISFGCAIYNYYYHGIAQ